MQARAPRILVVDDDRKDLDTTLATIRTHCASYEARIAMAEERSLHRSHGARDIEQVPGRGKERQSRSVL